MELENFPIMADVSRPDADSCWKVPPVEWLFLICTISVMAIVCVCAIEQESVTFDERDHIAAGVSYLQRNDGRLNVEHPPLLKMLAGLPLVIKGVKLPYNDPSWDSYKDFAFGDSTLRSWGSEGATRVFLARIPLVLLTLALGIEVFLMARFIGGRWGGAVSLLVFASSPFFLGYGPLVLTDVGVAFFAIATVWVFASLWRKPSMTKSVTLGLFLSGALLSKFSSGLVLPVCVVLAFWFVLSPISRSQDAKRSATLSVVALLVASLIVYATYTIAFWQTDTVSLLASKYSKRPINVVRIVADLLGQHHWLERVSFPVVLYFLGAGSAVRSVSRATYLLGKIYAHGTRAYFPVLFALKMPPGFLCLVLLLTFAVLWRTIGHGASAVPDDPTVAYCRAIALLLIVFTTTALVSPLNIGIRHLSVPIGALTILVGLIPRLGQSISNLIGRLLFQSIMAVSVIACVYSSFVTFPDYIGYFNGLIGTKRKFEIAVDSNLDWGQTLVSLGNFMEQEGVRSIHIDSTGSVPELYVPDSKKFNCEEGVPANAGWVAVGASRFFSDPDLGFDAAKPVGHCLNLFKYPFREVAGGALYVFHVSS
jgi:hypothetical protein